MTRRELLATLAGAIVAAPVAAEALAGAAEERVRPVLFTFSMFEDDSSDLCGYYLRGQIGAIAGQIDSDIVAHHARLPASYGEFRAALNVRRNQSEGAA